MGLTQITTGGVDDNINIDSNTLKVDGTNNRVGIGTSSPSNKLDVGSGNIEIGGGNNTALTWSADVSSHYLKFTSALNGLTLNGYGGLAFETFGANERMRIDISGRLLSGTSSSSANVRAVFQGNSAGATGAGIVQIARGNTFTANNTNIGNLEFTDSSSNVFGRIQCESDGTVAAGSDHPGRITFETTADGSSTPTERVRIDSSGQMLIGTTTNLNAGTHQDPKVQVAGKLAIKSSTTDGTSRLTLIGDSSSGDATIDWGGNGNFNLKFTNNGSERARIDSSGRLLQGKTATKGSTGENIPTYCTEIASNNPNVLEIANNGTGSGSYSALVLSRSDATSVNGHTAVDSGDKIGEVVFIGADGSDRFNTGAAVAAIAQSDFSSNNCPTHLTFSTNGGSATASERMRIDSSGRLLVGTSSAHSDTDLVEFEAESATSSQDVLIINGGQTGFSGTNDANTAQGIRFKACAFNTSDSIQQLDAARIKFKKTNSWNTGTGVGSVAGNLIFEVASGTSSSTTLVEQMRLPSAGNLEIAASGDYSQALTLGGGSFPSIWRQGANGSGLHFTTNATIPADSTGTVSDNSESFGTSSYRWTTIFATTSTINTSDANEKQDIQDLSASELAVARELKGLFKTFRWKDAVAKKGDNARIHVGVIAQDVQQLFTDHGLDVTKYALWCSDTWYEVDGKAIASDGSHYTADSEGAVAKTRLGIRYEELLAFVLAAI